MSIACLSELEHVQVLKSGSSSLSSMLLITPLCLLICYVRFMVKNHFGVGCHIFYHETFIFFSFEPAKVSGDSRVGGACTNFSGTTDVGR